MSVSGRPWSDAAPAVPPPSRRQRPKTVATLEQAAVRLLHDVGDVLAVLTQRSPADFRPLPSASHTCTEPLKRALAADTDPLPASLLVELAPLLEPRLQRLAPRLRRRLGRTRTLQSIGRIREADPGCQRRNARRPGRTMLEKAGPRQELWGVRRVPRFDTTENRVLLAACTQFSKDIGATLEPLPMETRRGPGRAAILRGLRRAAQAVRDRPELEGIGRPRPGERPSNALLGDADYRAAWRAWRLLRAEEARFGDDWTALDRAWLELLELATWAALDTRADLEPVAGWVHVHHRRTDGRRLHTDGPRRWVGRTDTGVREVRVHTTATGVVLEVRSTSGTTTTIDVGPTLAVLESEDRPGLDADRGVAARTAVAALEALEVGPPADTQPQSRVSDALSLLDAQVLGIRDDAVVVLDACAAAELPVPSEAPVTVLGRAASWRPDALGPAAMWWEQSELVGRLVSQYRGVSGPAVVIPDALDDLAQQRLRREAGPCWLVPAPVAAALALHHEAPPEQPEVWLTVVRTAASLDIAVLERWADPDQPEHGVWIRSAPRHDSRGGRHEGLDGAFQGAAVRRDLGGPSVVLTDNGPTTINLPQQATLDRSAIDQTLGRWKGAPPTHLLLVGVTDEAAAAIEAGTGLRAERRTGEALVRGAARFLARHGTGLPTWKDRLPGVDLLVKRGRQRDTLTLIEPGTLVAPGDRVQHDPKERFSLDPATRRIRFPMTIDGVESRADLCIDGPPLPLPRTVEVRVRLSYVHGKQGLTAWLVPVGAAPFSRIPFDLVAADGSANDTDGTTHAAPPEPLKPPRAPYADEEARLRAAFAGLVAWRSSVDSKTWKRARSQAGTFKGDLLRVLKALRQEAEAALHGTTDDAIPRALRTWLCAEVFPWLAWLGGHTYEAPAAEDTSSQKRKRKKRRKGSGTSPTGPAPMLTRDEHVALARARAALRLPVAGDGLLRTTLHQAHPVPEAQWRRMLGRLCGRTPDGGWSTLTSLPVARPVDEGALADAVVTALYGNPELIHTMPDADAPKLIRRFAEAIDTIAQAGDAEAVRRRRDVYFLLRGIETLLQVRHRDLLPPSDPVVQHVRELLKTARDLLPSEVVQFAEHTNAHREDEQLARTLDALSGRYGDVAALE